MKGKLLRYNDVPIEIDFTNVKRVSGVSQSNVIIVMNTGKTHTGYMIDFSGK